MADMLPLLIRGVVMHHEKARCCWLRARVAAEFGTPPLRFGAALILWLSCSDPTLLPSTIS
jgi:hypothetical protein